MAKSKKTKVEKKIESYLPCEWVVQFDNDAPIKFKESDENSSSHQVVITIENTSESHITFIDSSTGKKFSIYARPKQTL
jgi:hypothetical protein